jgi:hypothetical protein
MLDTSGPDFTFREIQYRQCLQGFDETINRRSMIKRSVEREREEKRFSTLYTSTLLSNRVKKNTVFTELHDNAIVKSSTPLLLI